MTASGGGAPRLMFGALLAAVAPLVICAGPGRAWCRLEKPFHTRRIECLG
ncbi:MAG: hypothetical protein ACE5LL_05880 [Alphaproteobacteria bacterium]